MNIKNLKSLRNPFIKIAQKPSDKKSYRLLREEALANTRARSQDVAISLLSVITTIDSKKEEKRPLRCLVGGEQGALLLNGVFLLLIIALIATLSAKSFLLIDEKSHQRKQTYLCLKTTLDLWSKHQSFIKHTNLTIVALQAALTLKPNPALYQLKKATQRWQDLTNLSRWRKAISNKFCSGLQLAFIKDSYPLEQIGLKLKRNAIGEAYLKKQKTSFYLPSRSRFPFFFFIRGEIHFLPTLQLYSSREFKTNSLSYSSF